MNLEKLVCHCKHVTNGHIKDAVKAGAKTFEEVQEKTHLSQGCKRCLDNAKRVYEEFSHKK